MPEPTFVGEDGLRRSLPAHIQHLAAWLNKHSIEGQSLFDPAYARKLRRKLDDARAQLKKEHA